MGLSHFQHIERLLQHIDGHLHEDIYVLPLFLHVGQDGFHTAVVNILFADDGSQFAAIQNIVHRLVHTTERQAQV
jgi:hypothetical protein